MLWKRSVWGTMGFGVVALWVVIRVPLHFAGLCDFGVDGVEFSAKVKFGAVPAVGQQSGSYFSVAGRIAARSSTSGWLVVADGFCNVN